MVINLRQAATVAKCFVAGTRTAKFVRDKSGSAPISRIPLRHLRTTPLILLGGDQHFGRNPKITMQFANHRQRQRALTAEHFICAIGSPEDWREVVNCQASLLHHEFDGFDRVWRRHRKVFCFIRLYQGDEYVEHVTLRRACLGIHQAFD